MGGLVYRFVAIWFVALVASCFAVCGLLVCCGGLLSVVCFGECGLGCLFCVGFGFYVALQFDLIVCGLCSWWLLLLLFGFMAI